MVMWWSGDFDYAGTDRDGCAFGNRKPVFMDLQCSRTDQRLCGFR
jgi:hypothetical protein